MVSLSSYDKGDSCQHAFYDESFDDQKKESKSFELYEEEMGWK